jgi:hypothetical protein
MLQAYVGIVTHQGLEILCCETPRTTRWLSRRVTRARRRAVCIWIVLPDEVGALIQEAIRCGFPSLAMRYLCESAREIGELVPLDDDTNDVDAARMSQ